MEEEQFLDDSHAPLSTTDHRLDRNRFRRDLLLLFTINYHYYSSAYRNIILEHKDFASMSIECKCEYFLPDNDNREIQPLSIGHAC